jgi:mRNA interferase MazF
VVTPLQGEIWWAETAERKRRPVVIVTRSHAIPVLAWITIAPVTRSVRGVATEIPLGEDEGLTVPCAARFDNLQPMRKGFLTDRVGALKHPRSEICRALSALADC